MAIQNMKDLEKVVNKYIIKAVELTRDTIFEIVSQKVLDYYSEDVFEKFFDFMEYFTKSNSNI